MDKYGFYRVGIDRGKEGFEDISSSVLAFGDAHSVTVIATFDFVLSVEQMTKASKWAANGTMRGGSYKTWKEFKKAHKQMKRMATNGF